MTRSRSGRSRERGHTAIHCVCSVVYRGLLRVEGEAMTEQTNPAETMVEAWKRTQAIIRPVLDGKS